MKMFEKHVILNWFHLVSERQPHDPLKRGENPEAEICSNSSSPEFTPNRVGNNKNKKKTKNIQNP